MVSPSDFFKIRKNKNTAPTTTSSPPPSPDLCPALLSLPLNLFPAVLHGGLPHGAALSKAVVTVPGGTVTPLMQAPEQRAAKGVTVN